VDVEKAISQGHLQGILIRGLGAVKRFFLLSEPHLITIQPMNAPRISSSRTLSSPLTRVRIAAVATAAPVWVSLCLATTAAEPVAPSVQSENVAQPASKENSTTLFGQSFPAAPGKTSFPEALKSLAPKELLELGAGSPTRLYIERVATFRGQTSGSEETRSYVAGHNIIETKNGIDHWPYYVSLVEVHASKNDQGVSVINHMNFKGCFESDRNQPFKRGSRKEAKEMISALCRVMGRPQIQVRMHPVSELRYVSSDGLIWNTRNATIYLYFEKHLTAGNLNFLIDIAGPPKQEELKIYKANFWEATPKPLPADFAKQFDEFCDRANFDLGKR
jgi:hypothetical protein